MSEVSQNIVNTLRDSKETYEQFAESAKNNILIEGKRIMDWEEKFKIIIPLDPNPKDCINLLIQVNNSYEEAHNMYRRISVNKLALQSVYDTKYTEEFNKTRNNSETKIAQAAIEKMVNDTLKDYILPVQRADLAHSFFKQIVDKLINQRKIIESILIALGIEAKVLKSTNNGVNPERDTNLDEW